MTRRRRLDLKMPLEVAGVGCSEERRKDELA
jgi:hypothetical protein